jgi:hypothetical protein
VIGVNPCEWQQENDAVFVLSHQVPTVKQRLHQKIVLVRPSRYVFDDFG